MGIIFSKKKETSFGELILKNNVNYLENKIKNDKDFDKKLVNSFDLIESIMRQNYEKKKILKNYIKNSKELTIKILKNNELLFYLIFDINLKYLENENFHSFYYFCQYKISETINNTNLKKYVYFSKFILTLKGHINIKKRIEKIYEDLNEKYQIEFLKFLKLFSNNDNFIDLLLLFLKISKKNTLNFINEKFNLITIDNKNKKYLFNFLEHFVPKELVSYCFLSYLNENLLNYNGENIFTFTAKKNKQVCYNLLSFVDGSSADILMKNSKYETILDIINKNDLEIFLNSVDITIKKVCENINNLSQLQRLFLINFISKKNIDPDDEKNEKKICEICFTNPKSIIFDCNHTFCFQCSEWIRKTFKCPMCRESIKNVQFYLF